MQQLSGAQKAWLRSGLVALRTALTAPMLPQLMAQQPSAPVLWLPGAQKAQERSGLVAVPVALPASPLACLTAYHPSAPLVLMVVSVSSAELWARRTRRSPAGLTVPAPLIAVP